MQVLWIITSVGFLFVLIMLINRRLLREQYSMLWLLFGVVMLILSVRVQIIDALADAAGIDYAPALLFLVGILFCVALILHLTVIVSKLSEKVIRLTQELGILHHELHERKRSDS
ncbi:DUF2304 domain-containing protein [Paenibacillus prosopidis]|uniref:DUF2304 domain-containing protein n=1 Tax=Paenibacillus prosopidis TaxID=630520 RepID=A0A368VXK1_9BACL|nr:DUF2304 domain-containing protein [Paenibacillus prosopidis]RCW44912.1 hypothetical protein DFP97_111139 [Paenibacillus prosopidis]